MIVRDKVLQYLASTAEPTHWRILASKTGLNPNSVRSALSRLLYAGIIERPVRSFYCIKTAAGTVDKQLLVHSVQIRVSKSFGFINFDPIKMDVGGVVIKVGRYLRMKRISGFIGHSHGMDLDLFKSALLNYSLLLKDLVGKAPKVDDLQVINVQFNRDLQSVRLEGVKAITVTSVLGVLERFYNKPGRLRYEIQAVPKSMRDIEFLLRGGVTGYNLNQTMFALVSEMREVKNEWKHQTPLLRGIYGLLRELVEKEGRMVKVDEEVYRLLRLLLSREGGILIEKK